MKYEVRIPREINKNNSSYFTLCLFISDGNLTSYFIQDVFITDGNLTSCFIQYSFISNDILTLYFILYLFLLEHRIKYHEESEINKYSNYLTKTFFSNRQAISGWVFFEVFQFFQSSYHSTFLYFH